MRFPSNLQENIFKQKRSQASTLEYKYNANSGSWKEFQTKSRLRNFL